MCELSGAISLEGAAMKPFWLQYVWYVVKAQLDPLSKPDSSNKFHSHHVHKHPYHKPMGKITTYAQWHNLLLHARTIWRGRECI